MTQFTNFDIEKNLQYILHIHIKYHASHSQMIKEIY